MNKSNNRRKKGEIWVSAVLYTLIITAAIILILKVGVPIIEKMKDKTSFSNAKETMLGIDKTINDIANEGEGSQRIIPIEIKNGKITLKNNEISWTLETKTNIMESRSSENFGNLKVSSNANVNTIEYNDSFTLETTIEGDQFNVSLKKIGSEQNYSNITTSELINSIYYDGERLNGTFNFSINNDDSTSSGTGYTKMIPNGDNNNVGNAKVIAHINSTNAEYDLEFTLESFADFLTVELKNVVNK